MMLNSKKIIRKIILPTAMQLGADKIVRQFAIHSMLNVMYHGVVNQRPHPFTPRHITVRQFENHLIYFKKNFDIIPVAEAFENYRNHQIPKRKALSITFDDGYANNLHVALPLLEKHQVPATFFILGMCTEDLEIRALWADVLACLRFYHKGEPIVFDGLTFDGFIHPSSGLRLRDYVKKLPYGKRDALISELIDRYRLRDKINQIPQEAWQLMNMDGVIELSKSPMATIGSHGYWHFNLGNIDRAYAKKELVQSKLKLEEVIGKPVDQIAYPDGSYSRNVLDEARDAGYLNQLAVNYLWDTDKNDSRILNRHGISSTTTHESNMLFVNRAFSSKGFC